MFASFDHVYCTLCILSKANAGKVNCEKVGYKLEILWAMLTK